MKLLLLSTIFILSRTVVNSYKILIIHPTPSFSHQQPVMVLTEALIKKGHELFVVSPNVIPGLENNYTYADLSFAYKYLQSSEDPDTLNLQRQYSRFENINMMKPFAAILERQFKSEPFLQFQRQVMEKNISFDVVIGESFIMSHICGIAEYLAKGKPIMSFGTLPEDMPSEWAIGNIYHLSYGPGLESAYTDRMNIWQRLDNWFSCSYIYYEVNKIMEEGAIKLMQENYGPEYAAIVPSCFRKPSLLLLSSNFLNSYPRLLAPNVIELGPMHIKPPQALPKVVQNWLDGAKSGVILFSFGSNMKSKSLPEDVRSNFLRFFKELPAGYRVLWKWELDGEIPGQSDNILAQKWLPQQGVLAHPKVKAFITQGGLQSFQEAIHFGVPMIGTPWFGDQEFNVAKMVDAGIGVLLPPQELHSYEAIKAAVSSVLFNESYAAKMKQHSAISRDLTPYAVDKAVFWVEHVARHGGASHLRPSTADTTLFEYLCLDIISVILAISLTILIVTYLIVKYFIKFVHSTLSCKIKQS
uniref:UDP-glucuronosyltransferase n=1 Tax=Trialeurodes vaporariorum TaxID=88556 RepID=A0A873P519_TRIVP|nr:UDP-gluconosyltransferase [Trialeurodes vaporariorum]